MRFDRAECRFSLVSVHSGHTLEEVRDNTGFDFDVSGEPAVTPLPDEATLSMIRSDVARDIGGPYPDFARNVLGLVPA
jgi:glutaconate CoA-transferase subunit B